MDHVALALFLTASPLTLNAFLSKSCPKPTHEAASNTELKEQASKRADCMKRTMDKELDKYLLPLKKRNKTTFEQWMKVQATFNKWVAASCAADEELDWVNPSSHQWTSGTASGLTYMACLESAYGQRAYFAHGLATQSLTGFAAVANKAAKKGEESKQVWSKTLEAVHAPQVQGDDAGALDPKRWDAFVKAVESVASLTETLAREQCAALPADSSLSGDRCKERLTLWLYSLLLTDAGE